MQIVSSSIAWQEPQADGRLSVRELHIDDAGNEWQLDYLIDANADLEARLAEHAAQLVIDEENRLAKEAEEAAAEEADNGN